MKPIPSLFLDLDFGSKHALTSDLISHDELNSIGSMLEKLLILQRKNFISRVTFNGHTLDIANRFNVRDVEVSGEGRYKIFFETSYAGGYSVSGGTKFEAGVGFGIVEMAADFVEIQMLAWPPKLHQFHELVSVIVVGEIVEV